MKHETVTNDQVSTPVIKFNMKDDDRIRTIARQGYQVKRNLKEAGISFKNVLLACRDQSVRTLFRLPPDSDLLCLEIDFNNKTDEQKLMIVEDIKNNFLLLENFRLIDEKPYMYDKSNNVYRFLFKYGIQK